MSLLTCPFCGKLPALTEVRYAEKYRGTKGCTCPPDPPHFMFKCCDDDDFYVSAGDSQERAAIYWNQSVESFLAIRREQHADEMFDLLKRIISAETPHIAHLAIGDASALVVKLLPHPPLVEAV